MAIQFPLSFYLFMDIHQKMRGEYEREGKKLFPRSVSLFQYFLDEGRGVDDGVMPSQGCGKRSIRPYLSWNPPSIQIPREEQLDLMNWAFIVKCYAFDRCFYSKRCTQYRAFLGIWFINSQGATLLYDAETEHWPDCLDHFLHHHFKCKSNRFKTLRIDSKLPINIVPHKRHAGDSNHKWSLT